MGQVPSVQVMIDNVTTGVAELVIDGIQERTYSMVGELFYGFVNNNGNAKYIGKLVQVMCHTSQAKQDARRIGLVSRHEFCWDILSQWDKIPRISYLKDYLGPGIVNFDVFDLPYDQAYWMSRLNNSTHLTQLTLPGSHDAGTAQSCQVLSPWTRTQAYSIISQLILGVRVFDIRPIRTKNSGAGREDGEIWTHHSGHTGENLSRAVNCVRLFLQAYPSETVIFVLSHYENVSQNDVYTKIGEVFGPNFLCDWQGNGFIDNYLDDHKFQVGQVRGKLIAIDENVNTYRHQDKNENQFYPDVEGTNQWSKLLRYLQAIRIKDDKKLNRYVTALTVQVAKADETPKMLAIERALPGLKQWLLNTGKLIGAVEADWFGKIQDVHDIISLIINKNEDGRAVKEVHKLGICFASSADLCAKTLSSPMVEEFYGFVNNHGNEKYRGKLVQVMCRTSQAKEDARKIGLVSRNAFGWDNVSQWDKIPLISYVSDNLGPGIDNFDVFDLPYDQTNWMSKLNDSTHVTQLTLPGSHDAQYVQVSGSWTRTQAYSIISQLILGVRVFDIRPTRAENSGVGREDGDIWTHHSGYKGENLSRAVNCVRLFLEAYPSETVIFVLSHYENVSQKDVYTKIGEVFGPKFLCDWQGNGFIDNDLHDHKFKVGQVRGKLIAIDENVNTYRHDKPEDQYYPGVGGTNEWPRALQYLKAIKIKDDKKLNRYVTTLTVQVANIAETPKMLAIERALPGLKQWLLNTGKLVGAVEADWFGKIQDVHDIISLIINKNFLPVEVLKDAENPSSWLMQNGGDGWVAEKDDTLRICFASSFDWCVKSQLVDLIALGFKPEALDSQPVVKVTDKLRGVGVDSGQYRLRVALMDANKRKPLNGKESNVFEHWEDSAGTTWQEVNHTFQHYGPGLRFINFEHSGKDKKSRKGHYGVKVGGSSVRIGL